MHVETPNMQHLGDLPRDVLTFDAGLLQPGALARIERHLPDVRALTVMIDDPAALAGPPLPQVRRLELVRAADLPRLWPALSAAFPGLRSIDLVRPPALTAADVKTLAAHGLEGLGLIDPPPGSAAALATWPGIARFRIEAPDPTPWLMAVDAVGISDLTVRGPVAVEALVGRFGGPVLRRLRLFGVDAPIAADRLAALTGLEALFVEPVGRLSGLGKLRGLRTLEIFGGPGPDPIALAHLRHLTRLRLEGCAEFDGGGLTLVVGLPALASLDISRSPQLVPSDLMVFQTAPAPKALAMRHVAVSGGLTHLRALGITRLDLRGCALDAGDFAELAAMSDLERLDLDLLAWSVDRIDREALLVAQPDALAHYRYTSRALPDGGVEETVVDAQRPWLTRTRVEGAETAPTRG